MSHCWNTFLVGTKEQVVAANAQIDKNCGFPNGSTETWAIREQAYNQDFWFISTPPRNGYRDDVGYWTYRQMLADVVDVVQKVSDPSWWPPKPLGYG